MFGHLRNMLAVVEWLEGGNRCCEECGTIEALHWVRALVVGLTAKNPDKHTLQTRKPVSYTHLTLPTILRV